MIVQKSANVGSVGNVDDQVENQMERIEALYRQLSVAYRAFFVQLVRLLVEVSAE